MEKIELGKIIRKRRKLLNVKQSNLAELAGVAERTIREIESGKGNASLDTLIKIFEVLGLEMNVQVMQK